MNCKHYLETTREHVPARRKPGCWRTNPLVVVLECELHGKVTPRPAKDKSVKCCQTCPDYSPQSA